MLSGAGWRKCAAIVPGACACARAPAPGHTAHACETGRAGRARLCVEGWAVVLTSGARTISRLPRTGRAPGRADRAHFLRRTRHRPESTRAGHVVRGGVAPCEGCWWRGLDIGIPTGLGADVLAVYRYAGARTYTVTYLQAAMRCTRSML